MTFTTLTFVLFLPLVWVGYWLLRVRALQNLLLLVASYIFYGWWDVRFCVLMLASSLVDYAVSWLLDRTVKPLRRRLLLAISLLCNLGLLGYFKYANFFIDNVQQTADLLGWPMSTSTLDVILPVGISFYTFQTMGYTIDVYRGKMRATSHLIDYLAYVSFFPQLVAGPIERANNLLPQFLTPRTFQEAQASDGLRLILWGFAKKMMIADQLARLVDPVYASLETHSGLVIVAATVCFAFQIYCDFSAYSDIAIGTARLFGIELMRNFDTPYFSQSVSAFWRCWHISLSTWFRDYVYLPLGGSKVGSGRTMANVMAVFLLSGLWHGASWTFIIWGGIMGAAVIMESIWQRAIGHSADAARFQNMWPMAGRIYTFALINLGWIFFRAADLSAALLAVQSIIGDLFTLSAWEDLRQWIELREHRYMILLLSGFVIWEWFQRKQSHALVLPLVHRWQRWVVYTALLWVTFYFGPLEQSSFLYFQF